MSKTARFFGERDSVNRERLVAHVDAAAVDPMPLLDIARTGLRDRIGVDDDLRDGATAATAERVALQDVL